MQVKSCLVLVFPMILMGCGVLGIGKDRDVVTRGSVCGIPMIQGEVIDRVTSDTPGCGVSEPVQVTSVGGVALSRASVMECRTAEVLSNWVQNDVDQIVGRMGGGVTEIQVAAHYV